MDGFTSTQVIERLKQSRRPLKVQFLRREKRVEDHLEHDNSITRGGAAAAVAVAHERDPDAMGRKRAEDAMGGRGEEGAKPGARREKGKDELCVIC